MLLQNTLSDSGSPYLHQHAHQTVAWQQWSEGTLRLARRMDRPLFLSIGYATCHWCHVMSHDSFDDERVAQLLNADFVPVKIDREERPDVDQFYMTACQASGRRGGWPLTVVALPDGKPFYVATFIPRISAPGQAGLVDLLTRIAELWKVRRSHVEHAASELHQALEDGGLSGADSGVQSSGDSAHAVRAMSRALYGSHDEEHGGFGAAPKFPSWHHLGFLLRMGDEGCAIALRSLLAMRTGGVWDHVGGGFHRYSTDNEWRLPHFEKMLYDQAWALRTCAEAYAATGRPFAKETAHTLVQALLADFRAEDGLFHAAWDADSEGEEGRYHTWTWDELGDVLGDDGRRRLGQVIDIHPEGNFRDEATSKETGRNLMCANNYTSLARVRGELSQLRAARAHREAPLCDTKRLADWNGMTLSGLALAARYTGDEEAFHAASRLGAAAWDIFMAQGSLQRASFGGATRFSGQLDDYAFLAEGYIHLSEISGLAEDLERARRLLLEARECLFDAATGHWYVSRAADVPRRMTRYHDEAYASGASVLLRSMAILERMFPQDAWNDLVEGLRTRMVSAARQFPLAFTGAGSVVVETLAMRGEMTLHTDPDSELATGARRLFAPNLYVVSGELLHRAPLAPRSAPAASHIQICTGDVCHAPVQSMEALEDWRFQVGPGGVMNA